jgi:hypothetical protein
MQAFFKRKDPEGGASGGGGGDPKATKTNAPGGGGNSSGYIPSGGVTLGLMKNDWRGHGLADIARNVI